MTSWRNWALIVGLLFGASGLVVWNVGGGPVLMIIGAVAVVTAMLEPVYGLAARKPLGQNWRRTDERFIDPETGSMVTVWYDPATGERQYVRDEPADPDR